MSVAMGQPVAVTPKPSPTPGRARFELNRSLTGMGHERYASRDEARAGTPAAELARRLFDTGDVRSVHVFGSVVTVDLVPGAEAERLVPVIEHLYQYWKPGMHPPSDDELMAQAPKSESGTTPVTAESDTAVNTNLAKIPAALLARSQAALAKARAKAG